VYSEIEVWGRVNHAFCIKFYELIDSEEHDYMYLILELADLGQLSHWDYKQELYVRSELIYGTVLAYLRHQGLYQEGDDAPSNVE
jgi:serine/threonine protein kinase